MRETFYIPIYSMNLAHYLGSGIIAPSIYIENKNADIQDGFRNYLLLSSSKFTKETNCAIEIVINTDEETPKKISENFYLFDMPLPISRIKNIYFSNEEQKINTEFNITSGTAFIPEGFLEISQEENIDIKELENAEYKQSEKNWNDYLKKYDQILGGFSTMKISKEPFQNYPTHYFSTLGNINNFFNKILEQQNINIENIFQFAFTNEGKFKEFHNTIYSEIGYNEVERYAEKDNVKLEVKNGLVQIDKILENTQTYLVAILQNYGKGKRKQVDSFISDLIFGKFVEKKKEGLSLIFGLNKGYKAFRNKYKTSNFEVDIKFHLESKLDYYIIESIYQNVFNSLKSISSFKYIDNWFTENKQVEIKTLSYITYQMIDKTIIWKQRVLTPVEKLLDKIAQRVRGWFPSFLEIKKNEVESFFKEDIELLKNSIELDLKNKFSIELEQNRVKVDKLNKTILDKEKIINHLEKQLNEMILLKNESKDSEKEKSLYLNNPQNSIKQVNLAQEDMISLFTYNNDNITREQLEKLSITALKKKAKEFQIPKYSTYNKNTDLINEILKLTSKP